MDLLQYLKKRRGGKNVRSGLLMARKLESGKGKNKKEKVLVAWSKCKLTVDQFSNERAISIAEGRLAANEKEKRKDVPHIPPSIRDDVTKFVERCKKYYKTQVVDVV